MEQERQDFFEILSTQRAVRAFREDPVPDALIERLLEAASWAPSGGNSQPWAFVVVRDLGIKRGIRDLYAEAWGWYKRKRQKRSPLPDRARRAGDAFAARLDQVPALIVACLDRRRLGIPFDLPFWPITRISAYASIFPAVQNLLLAARALGLGSALTTLHGRHERRIKRILRLPRGVQTCALIPIGYPAVPFGRTRRRPVPAFMHLERWSEKGRRTEGSR